MTTRRKFLKKTLAGSAAFFIVPRHVLGRGFTAPSDKLGIAAIGIGGRGTSNLMNSFTSNKANIVALCDVDDRRKPARTASIRGRPTFSCKTGIDSSVISSGVTNNSA